MKRTRFLEQMNKKKHWKISNDISQYSAQNLFFFSNEISKISFIKKDFNSYLFDSNIK